MTTNASAKVDEVYTVPGARLLVGLGVLLALGLRLAEPIGPALDVDLLHARQRERAARHVLGDRGSGADVRIATDRDGRHQLAIAADERAGLDRGLVLRDAVVVAGDRAGTDVGLRPDRRVTEV